MIRFTRRDLLRMIGIGVTAFAAGGAEPPREPSLLTRRIPSSDESLPVIGLGTWQTFDVGDSPAERAPPEEVLRAFVESGGTLVDSSPMYGNAEAVLGDLADKRGLRPRLFIATKVWTSGKEAGVAQMKESMRLLRADPIDLMQVHNLIDVQTHLETLKKWKNEGHVRYTGVTHYTASRHDDVTRIMASQPIDFIQINYSAGEREAERRLLPMALERGVAVIANRPFAGGEIFRRLRSRPLPPWAAEIDCGSWAQLLLKFVVSHPAITCAIPATSKVTHLRDNMKAGAGRLPDEKLRARIAAEAS